MHITVDTIIGDILRRETDAAAFFREAGMHCIECPGPHAAKQSQRPVQCMVWMQSSSQQHLTRASPQNKSKFADPAIRRNSWNKTE